MIEYLTCTPTKWTRHVCCLYPLELLFLAHGARSIDAVADVEMPTIQKEN